MSSDVRVDWSKVRHGDPADRGDADAYYNRAPSPHKWLDNLGAKRVELTDQAEIDAYFAGYDENPSGLKCWD
jgi:hypothetical protein